MMATDSLLNLKPEFIILYQSDSSSVMAANSAITGTKQEAQHL